jgi:hypothetical protein
MEHKKSINILMSIKSKSGTTKVMLGDNIFSVSRAISVMDENFVQATKNEVVNISEGDYNTILRGSHGLLNSYLIRGVGEGDNQFLTEYVKLLANWANLVNDSVKRKKIKELVDGLLTVSKVSKTIPDLVNTIRKLIQVSSRYANFKPSSFQMNKDFMDTLFDSLDEQEEKDESNSN